MFLVVLLMKECSGSGMGVVVVVLVMAIVSAYTMRFVAGGYDNEFLVVMVMCLMFYMWCCVLRILKFWWVGGLVGLVYIYMVVVWGGYTFVFNMVGLYVVVFVLYKCYSFLLYKVYLLFFVVGMIGVF